MRGESKPWQTTTPDAWQRALKSCGCGSVVSCFVEVDASVSPLPEGNAGCAGTIARFGFHLCSEARPQKISPARMVTPKVFMAPPVFQQLFAINYCWAARASQLDSSWVPVAGGMRLASNHSQVRIHHAEGNIGSGRMCRLAAPGQGPRISPDRRPDPGSVHGARARSRRRCATNLVLRIWTLPGCQSPRIVQALQSKLTGMKLVVRRRDRLT
jgi:hypothetical protein